MPKSSPEHGSGRMAMIGPALLGASSLACADILSKVTFRSGADPLTVATLRGVIGLALLLLWLRIARPSIGIPRRERWISLGLGALFAGNVLLLFKAIFAIDVAIAILTYFVYPLLTSAILSGASRKHQGALFPARFELFSVSVVIRKCLGEAAVCFPRASTK